MTSKIHNTILDAIGDTPMVQLQQVDGAGTAAGWYYDAAENKVCLSLIERRIGDHYEIFVYHEDVVDYRQ